MSVCTDYDKLRNELKSKLEEAREIAIRMLDKDVWGYAEMDENYADKVYFTVSNTLKTLFKTP